MLVEAVEIIRELHTGELVDHQGEYFQVDSARVWDLPGQRRRDRDRRRRRRAIEAFAPLGRPPDRRRAGGRPRGRLERRRRRERRSASGARAIGQIPICWDPDEDGRGGRKAHEQFRWFGGGWSVNADLPTPAGFAGATQFVRPEDVADSIPCGPDLDAIVEAVSAYWEAGFTDIALVQIGDDGQERVPRAEAAGPLLEKLRAAV